MKGKAIQPDGQGVGFVPGSHIRRTKVEMATKIADEKFEAREAIDRANARVDRQKARYRRDEDDANDPELNLYIRIAQSTIYPWKPTLKAVLKEIAYLRVQGETLMFRPYERRDPKIPYSGWCYASEEYLARRCSCSSKTIQRAVRQLKEDGVIHIRTWRDKRGRPHNEYFIIEETIKKFELDEVDRLDYERPKCTWQVRTKPHRGWFSKDHQPERKPPSGCSAGCERTVTTCSADAERSLNDPEQSQQNQQNVATSSRYCHGIVAGGKPTGQMDREPQDNSLVSHGTYGSSAIGQGARDATNHLSEEVGFSSGVKVLGVSSTSWRTTPSSASRNGGATSVADAPVPLRGKTETQDQPQDRGALPHTPAGGTPAPPCGGMGVSSGLKRKKRTKCASPNCRGKASPSGTGYCSRCDYERTAVGAKPGKPLPTPEPVVKEKPTRTNGSSPAPKALSDISWRKEPAKAPKPLRSAFATRQEYTKACCRAGYILEGTPDEREPGVPLPLRSSYKTRYEYELACWHAGVAADNEDGTPGNYVPWGEPEADDYCKECGFMEGSRNCQCHMKKRAAAAPKSFVEEDLD